MKLTDLKAFGFPGGERHLETSSSFHSVGGEVLTAHIRNSNDFMDLLLATDVLQSRGIKPAVLELPYMPYARQDRRTTHGSPYSLKVVAKLINDLKYEKVRVYEPHSPITASLIENCEVETFDRAAIEFMRDVESKTSSNGLVAMAPDAGAVTRVSRIQETTGVTMAVALKKRDPETGWLKIKHVFGDIKGTDVFVFDDICDGGATFIQLAQYIRENVDPDRENTRLHLFVAHGIFSKGIEKLLEWYDTIGTTDSFYAQERVPPGTPQKVWVYPAL